MSKPRRNKLNYLYPKKEKTFHWQFYLTVKKENVEIDLVQQYSLKSSVAPCYNSFKIKSWEYYQNVWGRWIIIDMCVLKKFQNISIHWFQNISIHCLWRIAKVGNICIYYTVNTLKICFSCGKIQSNDKVITLPKRWTNMNIKAAVKIKRKT